MKRKKFLQVLVGIAILILLFTIFILVFLKPWIEKKIMAAINNIHSDYTITVEGINAVFLPPGVEWNGISIDSKNKSGINAKVQSIKFKGVNLIKFLFNKDVDIKEVVVSGGDIRGKLSFDKVKQIISSLNINADKIIFDRMDLSIRNAANKESWLMKDGAISFYNFELLKKDTLLFRELGPFDLKATQLIRISPDSFYTFKIDKIICSVNKNSLQADKFSVVPNYKDYDFTSRHEFQTDCVTAEFSHITFSDFSLSDYFKSNALVSPLVEINSMEINVFRDRRKKFQHKKKPMLQDILYDYPGKIKIDTVHLRNGDVTYREHGENSKEAGTIRFKKINTSIYHIINDTAYKIKNAFVELKSEAQLMGAAKVIFNLKVKLFDSTNTFLLSGGLSRMDVQQLNPLLERNVFIHAESGNIDTMYFNFTGDNYKSSGNLTLLYDILFVKPEAQHAVVPASLMQLLVSSITSRSILDANPMPGEKMREGVVDFKRDPERFVFNYYFKSVLSGIKSTIAKNEK
jgi:hypothetical protein